MIVELYTPHPGQVPLHHSIARFRIATCGRRFGKTYACVNEIAKHALEHPRSMGWWVAPTFQQTKIAFRLLTQHFRDALAGPPSLSELRCEWVTGSVTQFRSADNFDALRGEGVHFLVMDEAAMIARDAWEKALRPTLADTNGRAIFISSPRGRNWFHELWSRGQDRERWPDHESWQFPTSANPYIPASEIEAARDTLPADVFRQEMEAQFLEDSAGVFRGLARCEAGTLLEPIAGHTYVIGWDPAKHADASVVTVVDEATGHVVAWERFLVAEYTRQMDAVESLCIRYNHARLLMDATHGSVGDPLVEQMRQRGLDATGFAFTATSKQQLVEHLAVQIDRAAVTWPAELRVLRGELEVFRYEVTRAGNVRYSAPDGYHDDAVCSLALAVWHQQHGPGFLSWLRAQTPAVGEVAA